MQMLKIDFELLSAAVSRNSDVIGLRAEVGYLNLRSGSIRFPRSTGERNRLEQAPAEWVEIPKYYGRDQEGRAEFIRRFLASHGIDSADLDW
jgi:hypothetical protein